MARFLFLGDIVGRPGRTLVQQRLGELKARWSPDFVIANAENAAGGAGLSPSIARELRDAGCDALTLGDHVWDQIGFDKEIDNLPWVCRPANLPAQAPGRKFLVLEKGELRFLVCTVLGRQFITPKTDCLFATAVEVLEAHKGKVQGAFVEVHAEATSEKIALGWYLDGRATAVVGTHTHVATADETVLPRGTGYLTDVGMCGPHHGVLGREIQPVIARFLDGVPRKFNVAENDVRLNGVIVDFDPATGRSTKLERFTERA